MGEKYGKLRIPYPRKDGGRWTRYVAGNHEKAPRASPAPLTPPTGGNAAHGPDNG